MALASKPPAFHRALVKRGSVVGSLHLSDAGSARSSPDRWSAPAAKPSPCDSRPAGAQRLHVALEAASRSPHLGFCSAVASGADRGLVDALHRCCWNRRIVAGVAATGEGGCRLRSPRAAASSAAIIVLPNFAMVSSNGIEGMSPWLRYGGGRFRNPLGYNKVLVRMTLLQTGQLDAAAACASRRRDLRRHAASTRRGRPVAAASFRATRSNGAGDHRASPLGTRSAPCARGVIHDGG